MKKLVVALSLMACTTMAMATEQIKFVLPFPPGGQSDQVMKILQNKLSQDLNRTVVAEYKPGAGGEIASAYVANSKGPGLVLLFNNISMIMHPPTKKKSYKDQDLMHLATIATFDSVLVVPAAGKIKTWDEFINGSNSTPVNFGAFGLGGLWLSGKLLQQQTWKNITVVPYKGGVPILVDIIGNRLDMAPFASGFIREHVQAGKVIPIAAISKQRLPDFPQVPTLLEKGYSIDGSFNWTAVFANRTARSNDLDTVSVSLRKILSDREVVKQLRDLGFNVDQSLDINNKNFLELQRKRFSKIIDKIDSSEM
jgi:tripartite-type tricarboxylate transporter receptor subunit TctC